MSERSRKWHTPLEKIAILQEILVEKKSIKDAAQEYDVHPNSIIQWRKTLFDRGSVVFQPVDQSVAVSVKSTNTVANMERELNKRDTLVKELLEENIGLKKNTAGKR